MNECYSYYKKFKKVCSIPRKLLETSDNKINAKNQERNLRLIPYKKRRVNYRRKYKKLKNRLKNRGLGLPTPGEYTGIGGAQA